MDNKLDRVVERVATIEATTATKDDTFRLDGHVQGLDQRIQNQEFLNR